MAQETRRIEFSISSDPVDYSLLHKANTHCAELTAFHSRSFYIASGFLPVDKRRAVRALYAFCRVTDDIVDRHPSTESGSALGELEAWRKRLNEHPPPLDDLVAVAWSDARRRYHVPLHYGEQLIDGVARDLHQRRYQTFAELAAYSYGVASTVGLMSMHIIGYASSEAIPFAIKLGVALQITNILRDVAEDWRAGRLYLPQEELAGFGINEAEIAQGVLSQRWREFMRYQIERNRHLYREAWPGIALLDPEGRLAIAAAADLYQGILDQIEQHNYDVFSRRAHLSATQKLRRLPSIWWRSRTVKVHL